MVTKLDYYYMSLAMNVAKMSHGVRSKVGCCIVTENDVTILSCNGLPKPLGNVLEYTDGDGLLITKPTVIHAEHNGVIKCAKEGVVVKGASVYVTLSTCVHCASTLVSSGVKKVVYLDEYRDPSGVDVLKDCGILTYQIDRKEMEKYLNG